MNSTLALIVISALIIIHTIPVSSYHPDFTWKDVETMMNPDLRGRMKRGEMKGRRIYCGDCSEVTEEYNYRICGNNRIMYPNACMFACSQIGNPGLEEAEDYGICGPLTFKEFKQEFKSHY